MKKFQILIVLFVAMNSASLAAQPSEIDKVFASDSMLSVADGFYLDGDHYRAVGEYQRFLFSYPNDPRRFAVELKIAWVYFVANRPDNAKYQLRVLAEQNQDAQRARWLDLYNGQVALGSDPLAAKIYFERVYTSCANEKSKQCIELQTFSALGSARYHAERFEFQRAADSLRTVPVESVQYPVAQDVAEYVKDLDIPGRSPFLAGALSIVPGFGHFYLGEWGIGLVALIWNGVFIYATADSIVAKRYGQAALIGLLELIWYGGTMFGAVAGAHRFNRDAKQIVADGMTKDIGELNTDAPWSKRFPVTYPTPLQLRVPF